MATPYRPVQSMQQNRALAVRAWSPAQTASRPRRPASAGNRPSAIVDEAATEMQPVLDALFVVNNEAERTHLLDELSKPDRPRIVSFLNQHGFNLAYTDRQMRRAFAESDVLLRDGVGLELALKALQRSSGVNCNGTDLIPELLGTMPGRSIAVFGTRDPWLGKAADAIAAMGPRVVTSHDGFADDALYLERVRTHRPEIILLGMGMPRQELLAVKLRRAIDYPCLIINGGAILDFLGQRFPRAPLVVQRMRMEWLFRLVGEPKRLFGRYIVGGVSFALRIVRTRQAMLQAG